MCGGPNIKNALEKRLLGKYEDQLISAYYARQGDYNAARTYAENYMKWNTKDVNSNVMKAVYIKAGEFIETAANTPLKEDQLTDDHKRVCFRKHEIFGDDKNVRDLIYVNEFLKDNKSRQPITDYLEQRGLPPELDIEYILDGKFNKHVIRTYRDFLKNKKFRLYRRDKEIFGHAYPNVYMFPWQYLEMADTAGGDCEDKAMFLTKAIIVPFENSSSVSPEDLRKIVLPMIHLVAGPRGDGHHLQPIFLDNKNLLTHRIADPTIGVPEDFNEQKFYQNLYLRFRAFTRLPKVYHSKQSVNNIYLAFNDENIWGDFDPEPSREKIKESLKNITFDFTPTFKL